MSTKHSEAFYISSNLFDNRRLKRRLCKWMERLRERQQQIFMGHAHTHSYIHAHTHTPAPASKTERGRRRFPNPHLALSRRQIAATLPADITIDLLSDDDKAEPGEKAKDKSQPVHRSLQLSTIPNITLVPVSVDFANAGMPVGHNAGMLLMPVRAGRPQRTPSPHKKRYGIMTSTSTPTTLTESIVLTSDDDEEDAEQVLTKLQHKAQVECTRAPFNRRSPPPLAPLTFSETIEEVTVSLVPRGSTTANCQARQRRRQPREFNAAFQRQPSTANCSTPNQQSSCSTSASNGTFLKVDVVNGGVSPTLADETTVHTVIANRIYELSLSKLREGLASSGVPEYAQDILPEQLQKLSPAMRAKVAPMVAPLPPTPISLKLSSDLSISLISDDDDCESGSAGAGSSGNGSNSIDLLRPVAAAEAHAAAKLLKQQQPQLSVVHHLQYPGHGTPLALPVMAPNLPAPSTRRRKLG